MNPMIGEIRIFAGNYPPRDWAFCDGQEIAIEYNTALFSIIGTHYGGDGQTTFALPKIEPVKESDGGEYPLRYIICLYGIYPPRT